MFLFCFFAITFCGEIKLCIIIIKTRHMTYLWCCCHGSEPLREFTRFTWWMQTQRQMAANPQTRPNNLGCESASGLLPSTPTITIFIITLPESWYSFYRPTGVEGWVDLGTAVQVRSPCLRPYIAAAVAINTAVRGVWFEPGSCHTAVRRANHSATATYGYIDIQSHTHSRPIALLGPLTRSVKILTMPLSWPYTELLVELRPTAWQWNEHWWIHPSSTHTWYGY